ncbi:MAG: 2-amino-4-hydroxy-6-hydroxymethyldihydropteridine diphosphokinase [Bacteriovoracaceae bacterium]|jgi:2-amino-4-hydroxy-6-hydroxymethyldihydropteridine diphosphokinase
MSLVISLGTNLGNKLENLNLAKQDLQKEFVLKQESTIYQSKAVDFIDQPSFLNQILEFELPELEPIAVLNIALGIEKNLGRRRDIPKGPRTIDIDILFWGVETINIPNLNIPHPRLFERSFIVLPLKELGFYNTLQQKFSFPQVFCNEAFPLGSI